MTEIEKKVVEKKVVSLNVAIAGILIGIIVIVVIVAGIATQIPKTPTPTTTTPAQSTYVEVDYKTVGWFFDANGQFVPPPNVIGGINDTYLVLNVTITNHGYDSVYCVYGTLEAYVEGKWYEAQYWSSEMYNSTTGGIFNAKQYDFSALMLHIPTTLSKNQYATGYVIFEFVPISPTAPQVWKQPFTIKYSGACQIPYANVTVKIVEES
jgi:hypothetical protein